MSQLCRFPQCPKPCRERGYCKAHAGRLRRWGDPAGKNVLNGASQLERVLAGLPIDRGFFDCWPWQKARLASGYGIITTPDGRTRAAHRVVYEELVGPVPEGLDLDHLCRNKPCCNPSHLEPVTRSENNRRAWPYRKSARQAAVA